MSTTFIDYGYGQLIVAEPSGNNDSAVQAVEIQQLRRVSRFWPLPTRDKFGRAAQAGAGWQPTLLANEWYGTYQIIIGGQDVTYFRGVPTIINQIVYTEPFGDAALELNFPQVGWMQRLNHEELWFFGTWDVEVYHVRTDGTRDPNPVFEGLGAAVSHGAQGQGLIFQCMGALYQADYTQAQPRFTTHAVDIGTRIADLLDAVPSRNYAACTRPATGILTTKRGAWGPRLTGAVQELLADAWTPDQENQWTLTKDPGRQPVLRLKDRSTRHWTVAFGAPGFEIDLKNDWLQVPNAIYGEGTAPDGGHWRNTKYPGLRNDTAPVYPLSAGSVYSPGSSRTGFYLFVDRMRLLGYRMASSGNYYSSYDVGNVKDAQRRRGIQVDGIVGPQTWAAVFDTGSNINPDALKNVYVAPLAVWGAVEPYLYAADGSIVGNNPSYDPGQRVRVERYENFGEGVTKGAAVESAWKEIGPASRYDPNWIGTFRFTADPEEGSRWDIRAGQNIWVRYLTPPASWFAAQGRSVDLYAQADHGLLLHTSRVTVKPGGEVTGDLSWLPYDLVTLADVKKRNRDNTDPARRTSAQRRRSKQQEDTRVIWDVESGAGIVPRHALYGGLWTVLRIPAGEVGTIVKTEYQTDSPTAVFFVGVFEEAITANELASLVGNPMSGGGWQINPETLADRGLLIAWGSKDQPMGYYPKLASDTPTPPVTGRFIDAGSWSYSSGSPPWLWVAEYCGTSTFISGRLYPGVDT